MLRRILLALLLALSLAAPAAMAQDEEDPEDAPATGGADEPSDNETQTSTTSKDEEDEEDDDAEREVSVSVTDSEVEFSLERESAASEDRIEVRFDTSDAGFEVNYEAESGNTELEKELEVWLHQLVEYVDANANGKYDEGEEIVGGWDLSSSSTERLMDEDRGEVTWRPLSHMETTSATGVPGHKIEARADFGTNGVFGLDLYAFGAATRIGDATVGPTEVKIDIIIQNYPYVREGTALAILVETGSSSEFETDHEDVDADEKGLASTSLVGDKMVSLLFTWKETVRVDGVDRPVGTTLFEGSSSSETTTTQSEQEVEQLIVLSYPRGADILHDPATGVSYAPATTGSQPATGGASGGTSSAPSKDTPGFAVGSALAAVAAALIVLGRRKA